jgi:hypothetical protein
MRMMTQKQEKITIAILHHSTNIGNLFFEISIMNDLRKLFGAADAFVYPVEGKSIFPNHFFTGKKSCYLEYGRYTKADYFVFSGPIFSKNFKKNFNRILGPMMDRGTRFFFLSAGSCEYSQEEKREVRAVLREIKPVAISTRDQWTYDAYHDLAEHSHNGICSALFSSYHFPGYDTPGLGKYIVLNFEESLEPNLCDFSCDDLTKLHFQRETVRRCSRSSKLNVLLDAFRRYESTYNDYTIIRPFHSAVPSPYKMMINRPNKFVSTNPYSYLNIYRNADFVLAKRVHACVAALSYGKPAMLFFDTKRARLFDRLGLSDVRNRLVTLEKTKLDEEYQHFVDFLHQLKNDLLS